MCNSLAKVLSVSMGFISFFSEAEFVAGYEVALLVMVLGADIIRGVCLLRAD